MIASGSGKRFAATQCFRVPGEGPTVTVTAADLAGPRPDLQLLAALTVLGHAVLLSTEGMTAATTAVVVSLSGGALLANLVSVTILVAELVSSPQR